MPDATIDDLAAALERGDTVIDVREPDEYAAGHVPGAASIPMGRLPGRIAELDRSRPVLVVCASGNRSSAMADLLVAQGLDARSVAGGTSAWVRAGREVAEGGPR